MIFNKNQPDKKLHLILFNYDFKTNSDKYLNYYAGSSQFP